MEAAPEKEKVGEAKRIQIYSTSSSSAGRQVTPFWKEKYERDAKKYWDIFYKRHQDKFFKDRHYLDKEWGRYFQAIEGEKLVLLEVGCGAGNTIFPLLSLYPNVSVKACDFSPKAIELVKGHKDFKPAQINAFVCDLTAHSLSETIQPSSVDIVTMIFVLSAVAPEKMPVVLQNIKKVLKPNGRVLFRDYATGDLAQERFMSKEQEIGDNFYVRGDGTRAYYFSENFLASLFTENGFDVEEVGICSKHVENRSMELVMHRRWIQAVFSNKSITNERNTYGSPSHNCTKDQNDTELDVSDSIAGMFGMSFSFDEVIEIKVRGYNFSVKALPREHQHTCKSTGLMLWESGRLMCNIIAEYPSLVRGKRVLELGCGSAGICSIIAAQFADVVVSTDGDTEALEILQQNTISNLEQSVIPRIITKRLIWGNRDDTEAVKTLLGRQFEGFDIIIGTDVTYYHDAISPLFETAKELLKSKQHSEDGKPALVLCHIQRRVDEESIISTASRLGFELVDRWVNGMISGNGMISSWFSEGADYLSIFQNLPLTIMYFNLDGSV